MINFKSVKWSNFLSTGSQPTEIFLDRSPTTLIIGENGSGKSTVLDALCFALFGRAFRNINKPQLVNSINQKKCVVEVKFTIGKKDYRIVRGIKPALFEIYVDEEMINQDAASKDYQKYLEEHVLKLNFKSFTQIVILGSASFTPFMQLSAAARRDIIEDLLDIKVFSVMNDVLKNKLTIFRDELSGIDRQVEIDKAEAKYLEEYIGKLEGDKQKKKTDVELLINEAGNRIKALTIELDGKVKEKEELEELIKDEKEVLQKEKQVKKLQDKLKDKVSKIESDIGFYHSNDTCPTCSQDLPHDLKNKTIDCHMKKLKEIDTAILDLSNQLKEIEDRIAEIDGTKNAISEIKDEIIDLNGKIIVEQNYVKKLIKELGDSDVDSETIEAEKKKLKEIAKRIVASSKRRMEVVEEKNYHDLASLLLKDTGIKTKIIKQYLPIMNKIINKYLQAMDFFVSFELDEAFNETIKSRHRDEFSYASFSEGEKQRIDLALLFAWRNIAKTKNSTNTNLLILDEVFDSSLDAGGADLLYQILNTVDNNTNVFVISHRDALFDKFRSVIKFEKKNNYSSIVR